MKKYLILHKDRNATYKYFLGPHNGGYILTILYYDKIGTWTKSEEVILSVKVEHFFGKTEEELLKTAGNWIKENLGGNFTVKEVSPTQ